MCREERGKEEKEWSQHRISFNRMYLFLRILYFRSFFHLYRRTVETVSHRGASLLRICDNERLEGQELSNSTLYYVDQGILVNRYVDSLII